MIKFKNILKKIRKECVNNNKEESCGLIYKKNEKYEIYPCNNIALNKRTHFLIHPNDVKFCKIGRAHV